MHISFSSLIASYWSTAELSVNFLIFLNIFGALLLGMLVGYERSYHGRAAGMRTYGLVCMASAAITVISGYPAYWYGGLTPMVGTEPTRVIQGIVTGIGFLGAGVIMKEGFSISGLSTAASIWTSSAIGIMVGVGFYGAAIALALLSVVCMMWFSRIEHWLPSRKLVAVTLQFRKDFVPEETELRQAIALCLYEISDDSLSISLKNDAFEWRFVASTLNKNCAMPLESLSHRLIKLEGIESYSVAHAKN